MDLSELLRRLLRTDDTGPTSLSAWFAAHRAATRDLAPIDAALLGGAAADRVAFAFAAGYRAALAALWPGLPEGAVPAFAATEAGGVHPRAIETRLEASTHVTGHKRFVTFADQADTLLVVAGEGTGADGRNRLRVARVDARGPGVTLRPLPETPFTPEIAHAEVLLERAPVVEVLPGDGYDRYLKPFRTIEDVHVHAAMLGHVLGVAQRSGWPQPLRERLVAAIAAVRAVAAADPTAPEVHVALAGCIAVARSLIDETEEHWALARDDVRERWSRDRALLRVAEKARGQRLVSAWERLAAR
jgi:acyl-CoA dehydrogenase